MKECIYGNKQEEGNIIAAHRIVVCGVHCDWDRFSTSNNTYATFRNEAIPTGHVRASTLCLDIDSYLGTIIPLEHDMR